MNEKTKEIYQFLLSETDYLKEAGKSIECKFRPTGVNISFETV